MFKYNRKLWFKAAVNRANRHSSHRHITCPAECRLENGRIHITACRNNVRSDFIGWSSGSKGGLR